MRYSAILFDMDGTLNESHQGIIRSAVYSLEQAGYPVPPMEELRRFIGPPLRWSYRYVAGAASEEEIDHLVDLYHERYSDVGWKENRVYPGIAPLLRDLKKEGVYLAVASAKPLPFVLRILDYFGIRRYFDKVSAVTMEGASESKEQILRDALPEGTPMRDVAMVGDRMYDMDAGVKLGVVPVGVTYGYGSREELLDHGAEKVCESVAELSEELLGHLPEGRFLSFEGTDGCGKSTQIDLAAEYLRNAGFDVLLTREPGGTPIGEKIRQLLLDNGSGSMTGECEAYLFAASRSEHVRRVIRPALAEGKVVLSDRFIDSSLAYQGAGRELGEEKIRQINKDAVSGTMPILTVLLMADTDRARSRIGEPDRIESEGRDFSERVNGMYRVLTEKEPGRICAINADRTIEEVALDVRQALDGSVFR